MPSDLTDAQMRDAFAAAVQVCATGHDHCTYGGMSPSGGYWLIADGCERDHGEACAFCGQSAEVGFCDWVDGDTFGPIYRVVACDDCAQRWAALDPRWMRGPADEDDA